jgi:phage tail sheath protein FI
MPVAPTYPGVYVEELPSGVHTITGVSTSVTAFLGFFTQGPMNQATQIFSVSDLERTFGALAANSEAGYGVRQFFANGGAEAWVVRVAAEPPPGSPTPPPDAVAPPQTASAQIEDRAGGTALLQVTAASAGSWGNRVRLSVDYNTTAPASRFNLTVTLVDTSTPPASLVTEVYRNLSMVASDASYVVAVVNNASALVHLAVVGTPAATAVPAPTGTVSSDVSAVSLSSLVGQVLDVTLGTANLTATTPITVTSAPASLTELAATLQSQLRSLGSPPAIPTATVAVVPGGGTAVELQISAVVSDPTGTFTFGGTLASSLGLDVAGTRTNVLQYSLGATAAAGAEVSPVTGTNGHPPNATGLIGDPLAKTGIYALDAVDTFNILCLPDVMNQSDTDAFAVITAAETYCTSRRAVLIVDPPQGGAGLAQRDSLSGIQAWLAQNLTLRSSYAALYYPRPMIPDPMNGYRLRSVAASGTIAGLCAQTDGARGVWKAPAGTAATLTNVAALSYKLTDAENGVLNPLGINCLRSLPVYGNVCWGARTLDGADQLASDWKYLPVRRTALYIEASLFVGTQWVVFEPNDEPLWAQIRLNVGAFMRDLFRKGAFQGSTPAAAYFVKCDSETTTQADINLGVVNIVVGFAPLKPAEFVVLQIQQIAGQIPT